MRHLSHLEVAAAALILAQKIRDVALAANASYVSVFPIPRGGVSAAYALLNQDSFFVIVDKVEQADIILDDLIHSGKTKNRWHAKNPNALFATLFSKRGAEHNLVFGEQLDPDEWVVFPWEGSVEHSASDIVTRMLQFIGEKPERGGLIETPSRVIKAWGKWFEGYKLNAGDVFKTFEDGAEGYDEMLVQRDIPLYSHCEHHLAPFFGVAHIAYLPSNRIVGLSKLSRLVDVYAHRLQVQERLTTQIANALVEHLQPRGAAVVLECRHLCMESRGIQKAGTTTVTSAVRGMIKDHASVRAEFFSLLKR